MRHALARRAQREQPLKDDKILTSWNGYMIAALAKAAQAFNEPRYADAAARAADFILAKLRRSDGRLLRRYRDGEAKIPAFSEDYAYLIWGLIELYEATFETRYLEAALALNRDLLRLFWDNDDGGFFFAGDDSEELLVRSKEYADGALPSGNSVAALNLIRLGRMTGNSALEDRAQALLRSFAGRFAESPVFHMQAWWAIDFAVGPSQEIVIAAEKGNETGDLAQAVRERYLPRKVLLAITGDDGRVGELAPFVKLMGPVNGRPAAYICQNYHCDLPVTSTAAFDVLLDAERVAP